MEEAIGNELELTPPSTAIARRRHRPTLVQVGNRLVSSDGRFHPDVAGEYLLGNARDKFVEVSELSKMFSSNTKGGQRLVRKSMFKTLTYLLMHHGEFLVYELTAPNGRINAVKLLDVTSQHEKELALAQVQRMQRRKELAGEKLERAIQVIEHKEAFATTA